jgi:photoactive yellow protein
VLPIRTRPSEQDEGITDVESLTLGSPFVPMLGMAMDVHFDTVDLQTALDAMPLEHCDELNFGLIVMDRSGVVVSYNAFESTRAGLSPDQVLGRHFFESVAPCMNNYLVAQRFLDESSLDDFLDYVFTFRMVPTPVRLRLMARPDSDRRYVAVVNR